MFSFITRRHISRRAVLKGAGAALALPMLESMVPAMSATPKPQARFGAIYFPHGATMARWTPKDDGADFTFSEILQPLEPYRAHINVISNLGHPLAYGPGGATGNHNRSSATYLSGAKAASGAQPRLGITVDQIAARHLGRDTPLPSLELTIEDESLSCGEGLSCAYRNTLSWQNDTSPLPMQNNPQVLFEQLFGDGANDAQRAARRSQALSLLDSVTDQIRGLNQTLPASDRERMDRFVTDVREIERRIQQSGERVSSHVTLPNKPAGIPEDVEEHIKLMYDLLALAYQANITRVSTFMVAREVSNRTYPQVGVTDGHHAISHHQNRPEKMDKNVKIQTYNIGLFKYYLDRLAITPDGDGSLLDHMVLIYGSNMSNSNAHDHFPLPNLVVGGGAGALKGHRHLKYPDHTPMTNLLVSVLGKVGVHEDKLGDSTGQLSDL